jgi:hypothetical protein
MRTNGARHGKNTENSVPIPLDDLAAQRLDPGVLVFPVRLIQCR